MSNHNREIRRCVMTSNQLLRQQNIETNRHNETYEAEIAQHDRKMEAVEEERNRIDDHYKREMVRIQDDINAVQRLKVEYENTRDWAKIMGRNPDMAAKVAAGDSGAVKTHKHLFTGDTYSGDWKQAVTEYIDNLIREQEDLKDQWNREINNWTAGNSDLFLEGEKLLSNYYTSSIELNNKQIEAMERFSATMSAVELNAQQSTTLAEQADMYNSQSMMYQHQGEYYLEQANYQAWYNEVAPWQSVWGLVNNSLTSGGSFVRGIAGFFRPEFHFGNKGNNNLDPASNFYKLWDQSNQVPSFKNKYK